MAEREIFLSFLNDAMSMSMIALIEPVMIAVMEPFQKAQNRFQTALSN
jgi:hypothetical protein